MPKLSYKERARRRREQEILRSAARMIRDQGYVNLNMDDLAEEVGISKPTLYQHFKGKDDMVAKTMLQTMREMEAHISNVEGDTALDKLENIMQYMLQAHADPEGFSMTIIQDSSLAMQHLTGDNPEMKSIQRRVGTRIYEMIDQAKTDGDIHGDIPNIIVLSAMFSSMSFLKSPHIMGDNSITSEEIIENTIGFFRRGIAP